jgi:hypothetical protein
MTELIRIDVGVYIIIFGACSIVGVGLEIARTDVGVVGQDGIVVT